MSQTFDAIYEHGVLRPVTPLNLAESARVTCTLQNVALDKTVADKQMSAETVRQQQALDRMFGEVDLIPQPLVADNFSNRDHDFLIYGNIK